MLNRKLLKPLQIYAYAVAVASKGNPIRATATVLIFWGAFTLVEAGIERLVWGERVEHWLDPVFAACFIAFAAYTVWQCAIYNTVEKEKSRNEP